MKKLLVENIVQMRILSQSSIVLADEKALSGIKRFICFSVLLNVIVRLTDLGENECES
jgi:hypothetical protein